MCKANDYENVMSLVSYYQMVRLLKYTVSSASSEQVMVVTWRDLKASFLVAALYMYNV